MSLAVLFAATVAVFLLLDAVMLTLVLRPLFERHIADMLRPEIRWGAAAAFYVAYAGGLVWLAGWPAFKAALPAAVIGFMAYGTYEFTNYAVLRGWHWSMVAVDVTWGMVLSAVSAVAGVAIARWIAGG